MSWDQYITNLMAVTAKGAIVTSDAAICGIETLTVWAATPGYKCISADEIRMLIGPRNNFSSGGPKVAGIKTMLLVDKMDDDTAYSLNLKTMSDAEGLKYNLCAGKSHKALIILKGVVGDVGGDLSTKVYSMVDYLKKQNM
ncbi:profilin-3-like [Hippoglossus hippoglossus]|uniref:profilin-3-like n=1 Tax=Hippoglossus hippoglossus TaxID=8267 RepID=UPI00148C5AC8|nr:profilin-3-like [Hippoglossus hippoglossus]